MSKRTIRLLLGAVVLAGSLVAGVFIASSPAHADGCYTWSRTLREGMTGGDVTQLQIRVAGYPGYNARLGIDGDFGPRTKAAVIRFQQAYGLAADGIAGPQTFNKIYALQDDDCTPIHFSHSEMNYNCGKHTYSGGALSATATRDNAIKVMWRLEALRHAIGDRPITVRGFRDYSCNRAVGGASNSQHLYGSAADLTGQNYCTLARQARYHGFGGIFGPGYPGHNDHTHVDIRGNTSWSFPSC